MDLRKKNRIMLFPKINRIVLIVVSIAFIITGLRGYQLFKYVFDPNIKTPDSIIIPYHANVEQVLDSLRNKDILMNEKAFRWVSGKKDYPHNIKAGKYIFNKGMNTNSIVNMLKAGDQEPVPVTFNNLRLMNELAGKIAKYIEPDSVSLFTCLSDTTVIKKMGFNKYSFPAMFIPNTYEFYWTTTPGEFAARMKEEYDHFWNEDRRKKAEALGLTPIEVITLASIVQEETTKEDEKPIIAGLYINRLKKGMPLQADPTIRYALGDFSVKRILNKYLEIDSPFNTYKHAGLPPGPINFPEILSIKAVLNASQTKFLYMCAREDFSGYHNFSRTLKEHNRNARRYQNALNKRKILQ